MRKIIIILAAMLLLMSTLAATYETATITSNNIRNDIKFMNKNGIDIDKVIGNTIYLYLFEEDIQLLNANGYSIDFITDKAKEYANRLWEETKDTRDPMREYYSYSEYINFMQNTASSYPNICRLVDIGDSVNGNDILFMKISDNVAIDEEEPEVRYISSIHGDETVGFDFMIRLINLLTSEYGTNTRITNIVNNTELWINPLMNPDGYINHTRYNQNNVDLNRNFPTPSGIMHPDGNSWQPETQAILDWSESHYFTESLVFHGGATVMNYPWDYTPSLTHDDQLFQQMSLVYSQNYPAMYNSNEFNNGITNGNAWYETQGSIQDWSYSYSNCFDITCEVYDEKWPNTNLLSTIWDQNRESLLSYIEFAQNGIKGIVTDDSQNPIEAEIIIENNNKSILSHPGVGDYHRLLLPGVYTITARKEGFRSVTVEDVVVPASGYTTINFELIQAQEVSLNGVARFSNGELISNGQIAFYTTNTVITDENGRFSATLLQGDYQVTASIGTQTLNTSISLWDTSDICLVFPSESVLFFDNFDTGLAQWQTTGSWGIESDNGSNVLSDSPSGQYNNNLNVTCGLSSPIQTNGMPVKVSFDMYFELEEGYDYGYLEISENGNIWETIASYNGADYWNYHDYVIQGYDNLYLRFRLETDVGLRNDGIKIDNFEITSTLPIIGDLNGDRIISAFDIDLLADFVLSDSETWTITSFDTANMDNNNLINYIDAGLLYRYFCGTLDRLPVQNGLDITYENPTVVCDIDETSIFVTQTFPVEMYALLIDFNTFTVEPLSSVEHLGGYYKGVDNYRLLYLPANNLTNTGEIISFNYISDAPLPYTAQSFCNGFENTQMLDSFANNDNAVNQVTMLSGNYPNPFNPTTTINFSIANNNTETSLIIYDIKGHKVNTLVSDLLTSGEHTVIWDGKNSNGDKVASGVYFYRLEADKVKLTGKMVLMK